LLTRPVNAIERFLLANYQHLMSPSDRMMARSLVAADFDIDLIPKQVWDRVDFSGVDRENAWKLPIQIALRLLKEHKGQIKLPEELV
jgi:hypothetical protein